MSYTVIWFAKHKPDETSHTAHVSAGAVLFGVLFALVGLPLLAFWAGYAYMAPEALQKRLERQTLEVTDTEKKNQHLEEKQDALEETIKQLEAEALAEVNKRAEAEARVSMVDSAKIAALERVKSLENQVAGLRAQLDTFKDILQPTSETLPVQCYNISVQETGNGIKYNLSLLKTDNKNKQELTMGLHARVLMGVNVLNLDEAVVEEADKKREVTMKAQLAISGQLRGRFAKRGIRVLDIRGYDKNKKTELKTHCWKVF